VRLRPVPRVATWFLMEYGPKPEDESIIGDLTEQYQRRRERIWYWQQILAIVFGGLLREVRRNKRVVLTGLLKVWCWSFGFHFPISFLLMVPYRRMHPFLPGMTAHSFPLLTIQAGSTILWGPTLVGMFLSLLILILTGHIAACSSRVQSRVIVLAYLTLFVSCTIASMLGHLALLLVNGPGGWDVLIPDVLALLSAPALLLLGASIKKWERQTRSPS
jgi:hypothetical protein